MMLRQLKRDMSPRITGSGITVKSSQELDRMLDAGRITGEVLGGSPAGGCARHDDDGTGYHR